MKISDGEINELLGEMFATEPISESLKTFDRYPGAAVIFVEQFIEANVLQHSVKTAALQSVLNQRTAARNEAETLRAALAGLVEAASYKSNEDFGAALLVAKQALK